MADADHRPVAPRRAGTLGKLETLARGYLSAAAWDYLVGGAGEERTQRRNAAAYDRWEFVPRFLTGAAPPETTTQVLGLKVSFPVLTAPFGVDGMLHPEGQKAVARACQELGTVAVIPASSPFTFEEVAKAAPNAAKVAQIHAAGSIVQELTPALLQRRECGCADSGS